METMQRLADGSVLAHRGPMFLNVLVLRKGQADTGLAQAGVTKAYSLLDELARSRSVIATNITQLDTEAAHPPVVRRMMAAVLATGDTSLTPLAAVAGAVSDEVADVVFQQAGVNKVVVNNGGDIAIRLRDDSTATVGINLDCSNPTISHVLMIRREVSGVATSGFGGRSFTKGIASSAVAWAQSATLADALATILGNATDADDPLVERRRAQDLYPETDIPGHWITTCIGDISETRVEEALEGGMALARSLRQRGLDFETLLAVKGRVRTTHGMLPWLREIEADG